MTDSKYIEINIVPPEYDRETGELIDPGQIELIAIPPPTIEGLKQYSAILEKRLDEFARSRTYADIGIACGYVTSAVPEWSAEGAHCIALRDATWLEFYQIVNEVKAGHRPVPTWDELLELLPKLEWPDEAEGAAE